MVSFTCLWADDLVRKNVTFYRGNQTGDGTKLLSVSLTSYTILSSSNYTSKVRASTQSNYLEHFRMDLLEAIELDRQYYWCVVTISEVTSTSHRRFLQVEGKFILDID